MVVGGRIDEAIQECGLRVSAVRSALGATADHWFDLRHGRAAWNEEEVKSLEAVFSRFNLTRADLFDDPSVILPLGRRRRSKGTVTKGNAA